MKMRSLVMGAILLCFLFPSAAQNIKTVSGTYVYVVPETQSYAEAKEVAISRAKTEILADTYGTVMDVSTATTISNEGTQLHALSQSQVKGEWLETIGEPIITRIIDESHIAIRVEICGRVREISSASADFIAKALRGFPDSKAESNDFLCGDNFFLYFLAPADGYLAVYLFDGGNEVYCLLPYQRQSNGIYQVTGGKPYILFSTDVSDGQTPNSQIDEYMLNSSSDVELNRLYVIYSPHSFVKAMDLYTTANLPRELSFDYFQKWLLRIKAEDSSMSVKTINLTIRAN